MIIFNAKTGEITEREMTAEEISINPINYLKFQKQEQISELKNWFNSYFDNQFKQSLWQTNFTISYDSFFKKTYLNIDELKTQAEFVRAEIKRLENE